MPDFLFVYHGGKMPDTPEEGAKVMAEWNAWFENHGGSVVNPGNPVGMSKTVSSAGVDDNGGANPTSGFSIFKAADMAAAVAIAQGCPQRKEGTIEIAEIMEM
jgi:hypothetical protein